MTLLVFLAGLTVAGGGAGASGGSLGCPDQPALVSRLQSVGVTVRADDDVRVSFAFERGLRVATITMGSAAPRTIEHDGPDCSSLADATIALLSVLLDDRQAEGERGPPLNAFCAECPSGVNGYKQIDGAPTCDCCTTPANAKSP